MSAHPATSEGPSPALVFDTLFAYQRTAALRSAIELDLFRAIGEGATDPAALAKRAAASERGVRSDVTGHPVPTGPQTVVVGRAA